MAKAEFYCVKCKTKVNEEIKEKTKTSNGRNIAKGLCSKCGTKLNKFTK